MGDSAEPSGRFDFSAEDASRIPYEDEEEEKRRKSLGKKGMSTGGFTKMFRFRGKRGDYKDADLSELQGIGIRRYEYMELHTATQGFSEACKIGEDGSCVVYRGTLREEEGERAVAIKLLSKTDHREAISSYTTQVRLLSRMHHRNVVRLLGCCHDAGHLALVFEFMPNLTLDHHLDRYTDRPPLPWKVRYSTIAVGIASALLYLREGLECFVIHRDIRPSNIWLDSDFEPKLAGFRLSIVPNCDGLEFERVIGTFGYLDPNNVQYNEISKVTDIYSFGVVALEIASGRKAVKFTEKSKYLPAWVEELHQKGKILEAVDPKLGDDFNEREVERLLLVGLWCTQFDPNSRPSIKLILQILNFEASVPNLFISSVWGNVEDNVERAWKSDSSPSMSVKGILGGRLDDATNYQHGEDNNATAISTGCSIDRGEFKDDGDNDPLPILVQEVGKFELLSEQTMYNIGIPPNFSSTEITNHRKDHHRHILKGLVGSLREMMQSKKNLPRFDEALEKIKTYTTFLVGAIGPPLDDWNTLAQLVLRSLKEREDLFKSRDGQESLVDNLTVLSLAEECTLKGDEEKLEDVKERLACARQRCSNLVAELAEAQQISLSTEAEMKAMEQTIAEKRALLE